MDDVTNGSHIVDEKIVKRQIVESIFVGAVENGELHVEDRASEEIIVEFESSMVEFLRAPDDEKPEFEITIDYRNTLHKRARAEELDRRPQIAIILYATLIEHTLNSLLIKGFERSDMPNEIIRMLIKTANISSKCKTLWSSAGLPEIESELRRWILNIADQRNAFIHYKWEPDPEPEVRGPDKVESALSNCEYVVSRLDQIENEFYWFGRRSELLRDFRCHLDRLEAESKE